MKHLNANKVLWSVAATLIAVFFFATAGGEANRNTAVTKSQKRSNETISPLNGIRELLRNKSVKPGDNVAYSGKNGYKLIAKANDQREITGWAIAEPGGRVIISVNPVNPSRDNPRGPEPRGPTGKTNGQCQSDYGACLLRCALQKPRHEIFSAGFWIDLIISLGDSPEDCINGCSSTFDACTPD